MAEFKTSRPFEERFLNGYDRSQLRQEVQKAKRMKGLKKKYATWALGASLAFGGIGAPLKMIHDAKGTAEVGGQRAASEVADTGITSDLQQAKSIAEQVAGGVQAAAQGVESVTSSPLATVAQAPQKIAEAVVDAPQKLAAVTDVVKEQFFKTQVPFGSIIFSEARKQNISPELVAAVVHTESKFQPTARSQRGAMGLMQLVPATGRWMGATNLMNPAQNISAGTKYLRYLSDRFGGDEQKMIAAYNAGEGNVRRFNGVPPFRETRQYVSKVNSFQADLQVQMNGATQVASIADAR
ncbi:MAG: lytic transglycosylase domain-containing protein [Thermoanaerobaculia bacterium]